MNTVRPASLRRRLQDCRGFTLTEVLMASTLGIILSVGAISLFIQGLNLYHYDTGKLLVNRDIRRFTNEMTDNATFANYFMIFRSFEDRTRTEEVEDPATGDTIDVTVEDSVNDGESGDFLVLVYQDPADTSKVSRIVGYFRAPDDPNDDSSEGPVRRFDVTISPSSNADIWTLFPATSTANTHPEVIELSRGLSDGRLFYNFYDRSVMVKGQIFHSGSLGRQATNTYNFTISPRG